jgi:hypothetical protein
VGRQDSAQNRIRFTRKSWAMNNSRNQDSLKQFQRLRSKGYKHCAEKVELYHPRNNHQYYAGPKRLRGVASLVNLRYARILVSAVIPMQKILHR